MPHVLGEFCKSLNLRFARAHKLRMLTMVEKSEELELNPEMFDVGRETENGMISYFHVFV